VRDRAHIPQERGGAPGGVNERGWEREMDVVVVGSERMERDQPQSWLISNSNSAHTHSYRPRSQPLEPRLDILNGRYAINISTIPDPKRCNEIFEIHRVI